MYIKGVLVDFVGSVEREQRAAAAQVEQKQAGREVRVGHQPQPAASRRVQQCVWTGRLAILIQAGRVEFGIGNAEAEVLAQPCLLQVNPEFPLVPAGAESHVALDSAIEEMPLLILGGGSVVERISAGIVIGLILSDVRIDSQ